jgi:putative MATE family efflux protein
MTVRGLAERLHLRRVQSAPLTAAGPLSLNRQLFQLAWPSLVENLLQTLLGFVDLVFVGKLGADAIAGVGLGNQLMFLLQVLFAGLAIGNTALVARAIGAGDPADAERVAKQSLVLGAVISVGVAMIGITSSTAIVTVLGATADVTAIGAGFLTIVSVFSIVMSVMLIGGGTLRGAGDTRTPMVITAFVNVVNILLDYLLIFGNFGFPNLGAVGSAVATSVARGVGAVLIMAALFRRGSILKLAPRGGWKPHRESIARILDIGGPAAAEQLVFQLGFLGFTAIAILLGTDDLAAQQIAFNISNFSVLPAFAFGIAATTLVGKSLGARNSQDAEASAWQALKSGMIGMSLMGVGFFLWRGWLVGFYTSDPTVQSLGEMCMIFIAVGQPLLAVAVILASALRGAGDTRATLVITFIGIWVVRVAIGYLMGIVFGLGLFGVWLGWMADFVARAALIYLRFRDGGWKTLRA